MEKYECEQCDRNFASLKELLAHRRTREHNQSRAQTTVQTIMGRLLQHGKEVDNDEK